VIQVTSLELREGQLIHRRSFASAIAAMDRAIVRICHRRCMEERCSRCGMRRASLAHRERNSCGRIGIVPGASPRAASEIHVASQRQSIAIRHRDSTAAIAGSVNMCAAAGRGVGVARASRTSCVLSLVHALLRLRCAGNQRSRMRNGRRRSTDPSKSTRTTLVDINARGNGR